MEHFLQGARDQTPPLLVLTNTPETLEAAKKRLRASIEDYKAIGGKPPFASVRKVSFDSPPASPVRPARLTPTKGGGTVRTWEIAEIVAEVMRRLDHKDVPQGGPGSPGKCYQCGETGHIRRECPRAATPPGSPRVCYRCRQPGHFARECPASPKKGSQGN